MESLPVPLFVLPIVSVPVPVLFPVPVMVVVSVPVVVPVPVPAPPFVIVSVPVVVVVESVELLLLPELLQLKDANAIIAINNARLMVLVFMN